MRRHAKASSAGPTQRHAGGLGLLIAAFFAIPVAQSAAVVTVTLSGTETGTVISTPPGIECSNTPGNEKESTADCTEDFPPEAPELTVTLAATPDAGAVLEQWTGDALDIPEIGWTSNCNFGNENPCSFNNVFGETIDASFVPRPDPPLASTGASSQISPQQVTLEGTVDPEGAKVTQCRFEYGPTTEYGESQPCSPADLGTGTAAVPVSAKTGALEPGTVYHYRLVATNLGGKSEGTDATFTTPAAPSEACSNAAVRAEQGVRALRLPQCMAFELTSPAMKFNQYARKSFTEDGFSADGNRVVFESVAGLGDTPRAGLLDKYMAIRTASGWKTKSLVPPFPYVSGLNVTGLPCTYSPDFSRWTTVAATQAGGTVGMLSALRSLEGAFSQLSPVMAPTGVPTGGAGAIAASSLCFGGSTDTRRMFFAVPDVTYFPGEKPLVPGQGLGNILEAYLDEDDVPRVRRLQLDGDGVIVGGSCGAGIGGTAAQLFTRGAVSPDASRVYFTTQPGQASNEACDTAKGLRIMKRLETPAGPSISEAVQSECTRVSPPCSTADGGDSYQAASQEGTKLFFKTTRQLANSDLDTGTDLYLHDSTRPLGERLTQISAGEASAPTPGEGAEVLGLLEMGGDGSHAYFAAKGVLSTAPNAEGDTAIAGVPNLYLYERDSDYPAGRTVFVGTLDPNDSYLMELGPNNAGVTAVPALGADVEDQSVGGSGHVLVFESRASLTTDDTDGGYKDLFRFDSDSGDLERVSRAAPGGSDNGPLRARFRGDLSPRGPQEFSVERNTSEDGETIVFYTEEALDPLDVNGKENAYIWHNGEVSALPYGTQPTVSMSGETISFTSFSRLTWEDGDGASDVYTAKANGGFPVPIPPPPCKGEECQEPFRAQPPTQGAASDSFVGPGNLKEQPNRACPKGKRKVRRKGKTRCVSRARSSRNANTNRRAAK